MCLSIQRRTIVTIMRWLILIFIVDLLICLTNDNAYAMSSWFLGGRQKQQHHRSKRALSDFRQMMMCFQPWITIGTYMDYGCYCGFRGEGIPLDETDECCYVHDNCYEQIDSGFLSLQSYASYYKYTCVNRTGYCDADNNTPYLQKLCECDRAASECFLRARHTLSDAIYNVDTKRCCAIPNTECKITNAPHALQRLYDCDRAIDEDRCCVNTGYNSYYKECCNGQLHDRPDQGAWYTPDMRCCDRHYYDVSKQQCCYGTLHRITEHTECCGDEGAIVDKRTQVCVDGRPLFLSDVTNGTTIQ